LKQDSVDLSLSGHIARLTLNNPARHNALTIDAIEQFLEHLRCLDENPDIRVLILSGTGDSTFCSGASLDQIQSGAIGTGLFATLADRLAALGIPKIAAINGNAYGGGVEIGLCCDFRIGVKGMKIRVPAAAMGLCYPARGIQRYVSQLGPGSAKRILLAGETLHAPQLLQMGYLHEVVNPADLADTVDHKARELTSLAPMAVRTMLKMCNQFTDGSLCPEQAQRWVDQCNSSDDLKEGLKAALEKRKPEFKG
jgi:enoyl-CoA hydratase/carnithine racemase